jgi:hypothetical protein
MICKSGCALGGKAAIFKQPKNLTVNVNSGVTIVGGSQIRIYRWSQLPNTGLSGMQLFGQVAQGGQITVTMAPPFEWISVFAQNSNKGGYYDGCCFNLNGNTITILGFN